MAHPTYALLRRLRRDLRFRPVPAATGTRVCLTSSSTLLDDVRDAIRSFVPGIHGDEVAGHPFGATLLSISALHLAWAVNMEEELPRATSDQLRDLGFVIDKEECGDDSDETDASFFEHHLMSLQDAIHGLSSTTTYACVRLHAHRPVPAKEWWMRMKGGVDETLFPFDVEVVELCLSNTPATFDSKYLLFY